TATSLPAWPFAVRLNGHRTDKIATAVMTAKTDHRSIEPHISLTSRPIRADQGIHHARSWPQCARSTIWRVRRKAPGFKRGQPWALWRRRPVQLSPTKRHIRARILWSKNALPHRPETVERRAHSLQRGGGHRATPECRCRGTVEVPSGHVGSFR